MKFKLNYLTQCILEIMKNPSKYETPISEYNTSED